jgi:hypothetical protein
MALAAPAAAEAPAAGIFPAPGSALHYRITRVTQDVIGSKTVVSELNLRRKAPGTLTLDGTIGDRPLATTVLTVGADGYVQIPKADTAANQDSALGDAVAGLNRLQALFAGSAGGGRDGWTANVVLPDPRLGGSTLVVPIAVSNPVADGFDLRGNGQLIVQAQGGQFGGSPRTGGRRGGYRGGFPGGGYPGGGSQPQASDASEARAGSGGQPLSVNVSVDGRVRRGTISRLTIVETRSITFQAQPYVNVGSWTFEARATGS